MKDWYQNLQSNERLSLIAGAACLTLILCYLLIWAPLSNSVNTLQSDIALQKEDLAWMQSAKQQIQTLKASSSTQGNSNGRSLITLVDTTLKSSGVPNAQRMEPEGSDKVKLWMSQCPFDDLMNMLGQLQNKYGITVKTISISPTQTTGLIDARLTLTTNSS